MASMNNTQNTPNIPGLLDELIEMIALNLNPVDLACFRCTDQRTLRIIQSFLGSNTTPEDIMEKFARLNMWDEFQHRLTGVACEPEEYTKCTRWAIMARFEHDIDVEKAENLVCCVCKTKHPRSKFLPSDAELLLHICKANYMIKERMCVDGAKSTLFDSSDDMIRCFRGKDGHPYKISDRAEVWIDLELDNACGHCMKIYSECDCHGDRAPESPGFLTTYRQRYNCDVCPSVLTVPCYKYTNPTYAYKLTFDKRENRLINSDKSSLPIFWGGLGGEVRLLGRWRAVCRPVDPPHLHALGWFSSPLDVVDHITIKLD